VRALACDLRFKGGSV